MPHVPAMFISSLGVVGSRPRANSATLCAPRARLQSAEGRKAGKIRRQQKWAEKQAMQMTAEEDEGFLAKNGVVIAAAVVGMLIAWFIAQD